MPTWSEKERILRVRGKCSKERIVPYGAKARKHLEKYLAGARKLLQQTTGLAAGRTARLKRSFSIIQGGG